MLLDSCVTYVPGLYPPPSNVRCGVIGLLAYGDCNAILLQALQLNCSLGGLSESVTSDARLSERFATNAVTQARVRTALGTAPSQHHLATSESCVQ